MHSSISNLIQAMNADLTEGDINELIGALVKFSEHKAAQTIGPNDVGQFMNNSARVHYLIKAVLLVLSTTTVGNLSSDIMTLLAILKGRTEQNILVILNETRRASYRGPLTVRELVLLCISLSSTD